MKAVKNKRAEKFNSMSQCRDCFSDKMFITHESKFDFIETVRIIKKNGVDEGCFNPTVNNYYEIERNLGIENPNKLVSISMCIPRLTHEVLKSNIKLAAIIPFQIIIYEKEEKVYVIWWNFERMCKIYGESIAETLQKKSEIIQKINNEIIKNKEV